MKKDASKAVKNVAIRKQEKPENPATDIKELVETLNPTFTEAIPVADKEVGRSLSDNGYRC